MKLKILVLIGLTPLLYATEAQLSREYNSCMDRSGGVTSSMRECMSEEIQYQDKLLNKYYKLAMNSLVEKKKNELRNVQRTWIEYRKKKCDFMIGITGGSIDILNANSCDLDMLSRRVLELKELLPVD